MKHLVLLLLLCFAQCHAWSNKADLFAHVIYGWNHDGVRLDSADWDIQSQGGDRSTYRYDADGRISLNIRRTASILDTLRFTAATSDSLIWNRKGSSDTHSIRYTATGWNSTWDDGNGTVTMDTVMFSGDTTRLAITSFYEITDISSSRLIGYDSGSVYVYRPDGIATTVFMHFRDSAGVVLCTTTSGESLRFTRGVSGTTISDTLWKGSLPQQCWHWTALVPDAVRRLAAPRRALSQPPVDALGRGVAPRTFPGHSADLTRDRFRIGTLR